MRHQVAMMNSFATDRLLKTERKKNSNISTHVQGYAFWRGIATPGYLREQANLLKSDVFSFAASVDAEVEKLKAKGEDNSDYLAAKAFRKSMQPFLIQVMEFVEAHQTFFSNFWSTEDTINGYRDRLVSYYDAFKKMVGGVFGSFDAPRPAQSKKFGDLTFDDAAGRLSSGAGSVWDTVKFVAYTLAIALGIGFIVFMMG